MTLKWFPCKADKTPLVKWKEEATSDPAQIQAWQKQFGAELVLWGLKTGADTGILALDIDVKNNVNGFDTIKQLQLPIPDTSWQNTRTGGRHYLFKYPANGRVYTNRVGIKPGVDIRGEGGYVCFYGADLSVPLADAPEWILTETVKAQPEVQGTPHKIAPEIALKEIQEAFQAIVDAPAGEANDTLNAQSFRVGKLVAAGNYTLEQATQYLLEAALRRGKPERESRKTIESGINGGLLKPSVVPFPETLPVVAVDELGRPLGPRWTPSLTTMQELTDTSALKRPQLFKDWLPRDITLVTADGGTGKTTLALNEAIHLALGERFLGFDCAGPGRTLFITGEDTEKKLRSLKGQILRQMGLMEEGVGNEEKLQMVLNNIAIKKDEDLQLIMKEKGTGFISINPEALRNVTQAIEDFKPDVIVFDPISAFWGSEQALNDMARVVTKFMGKIATLSNAAVVMINHMGKSSSASKDETQFAGRGGTALPSHSRVSRLLRAIDEKEYKDLTGEEMPEGKSAMLCRINKFTDGSPFLNKSFLIIRDGYLFSPKGLSKEVEKEINKGMSAQQRVLSFVKEERLAGRYPSKAIIEGCFKNAIDSIPKTQTEWALKNLVYTGFMGEKLQLVDSPDALQTEKVYVLET